MWVLTDAFDNIEYHVKIINIIGFLTDFKYTHQIPKEINLHHVSGKTVG